MNKCIKGKINVIQTKNKKKGKILKWTGWKEDGVSERKNEKKYDFESKN